MPVKYGDPSSINNEGIVPGLVGQIRERVEKIMAEKCYNTYDVKNRPQPMYIIIIAVINQP